MGCQNQWDGEASERGSLFEALLQVICREQE